MTIASSVKNAIRSGDLHPGTPIASETDMASQFNVSPMTVRRALAELQQEGWVVRRHRVGTFVADRSARPLTKIALVCDNYIHLPQAGYFSGIEEALGSDFHLIPLNTKESVAGEARCLKQAAEECAAIICYPSGAEENMPLLKSIAASMPLLFIDCAPGAIDADIVMTDNYGSIQMGLRHLVNLGHSRIAYFMSEALPISSIRERHLGYRDFMKQELGVENPELLVRQLTSAVPPDPYYDTMERAVVELLSGPEPVTAIACQQDIQAAILLEACSRLGVSVPTDLAILSFSNSPTNQPFFRHIHHLVQRATELGSMAAKRIEQRLKTPGLTPQAMCLLADLFPARSYTPSLIAENFRLSQGHSVNTL